MDRLTFVVLVACAVVAYILATRPRPRPPVPPPPNVLRVDLADRDTELDDDAR